ncbi:FecR family protein [Steroidobacter sp.]|uniref:FecR family protein n=1 Tax=Steroidobacter sp. TaxID=1978227 RepID=UPI001A4BAD22|nr:FecR domain-containing protein [Steroidobacter sp.]MBL8270960.1 FecR domain-containing protein [Steroidobacter sp.]
MDEPTDVNHLSDASDWLLRLRDEQASPEDMAQWLQWYEADERHKQAFDEMQALWNEAGRLPDPPRTFDVDRMIEETAAAAQVRSISGVPQSSAAPRRRMWVGAVAASVLAAVVGFAWIQWTSQPAAPVLVREAHLPDGSMVQLAAKSNITTQYTAEERVLEMPEQAGEAYFSVAKHQQRPFIVKVGALRVRAVGTAFNIRRARERVVVTVTEGTVEVFRRDTASGSNGSAEVLRVVAGQQLAWTMSGGMAPTIESADTAQALAWQQGRLEYLNEPLAAVIEDINRYSQQRLVLGDAEVGELTFSGAVATGDIGAWLQALPGVFPVDLQKQESGDVVIVSREQR